jgi:hypothetical protein
MTGPPITFRINLYHGIWRVMRDGAFFGDYRSRNHAVEGAEEAIRILTEAGRTAKLTRDAPIAH